MFVLTLCLAQSVCNEVAFVQDQHISVEQYSAMVEEAADSKQNFTVKGNTCAKGNQNAKVKVTVMLNLHNALSVSKASVDNLLRVCAPLSTKHCAQPSVTNLRNATLPCIKHVRRSWRPRVVE